MTSSSDTAPTVLRPRAGTAGPLVVPSSPALIGRSREVDIALDDDSVSDRHARLEHRDGRWWITDLGSTNGTRVAGARLDPDTPRALDDGTEVRLGGFAATFHPGGAAVAAAEPAGETEPHRAGLRIPVWAVLLALLVIVLIVLAILSVTGTPAGVPAETPAGSASLSAAAQAAFLHPALPTAA